MFGRNTWTAAACRRAVRPSAPAPPTLAIGSVEGLENLFDGFAVRCSVARTSSLETAAPGPAACEFVGDIGRQQIAPRRQHLAELHEYRPRSCSATTARLAASTDRART
jgi:hypothetical protein